MPAPSPGSLTLDLVSSQARFPTYRQEWETRIGRPFSLPSFETGQAGQASGGRVRTRTTRLQDLLFGSYQGTGDLRTTPGRTSPHDHVRLWITYQGGWRLRDSHAEHTLEAASFAVHRGPLDHFAAQPRTQAWVLVLPAAALGSLVGRRRLTVGSSESAEVRLLVAHAAMIHETLDDLGAPGIRTARDTLAELAQAVIRRGFDDQEPLLARTLARAAKELAEQRLGDPELSPQVLARSLGVSLRTLQRAFAADGESVANWIRDRRLHHARQALVQSPRPPSITEVAARWQFADGSHFVRVFRRRYGCSPTEYLRLHRQLS